MGSAASSPSPTGHGAGYHGLRPGDARAVLSLGNALGRVLTTLRLWWERHTQREHLRLLDDHLLNDIGMTPGDALRESQKAFWER